MKGIKITLPTDKMHAKPIKKIKALLFNYDHHIIKSHM